MKNRIRITVATLMLALVAVTLAACDKPTHPGPQCDTRPRQPAVTLTGYMSSPAIDTFTVSYCEVVAAEHHVQVWMQYSTTPDKEAS